MKRRTPQEKKRLSYVKDRRNDYGENDKSSRKNIKRNKRVPRRANRRREQVALHEARGVPGEVIEDTVETKLLGKRPRSWRKTPDTPLGAVLEQRLARRARLRIDTPAGTAAHIQRIRRRRG